MSGNWTACALRRGTAWWIGAVLALAVLALAGAASADEAPPGEAADKPVVGWQEEARILPWDLRILAKLDTGAANSSLHAPDVAAFRRDGAEWVRFRVTDDFGNSATIEAKVVRIARIKRFNRPSLVRKVIRLGICVGAVYRKVQVSLQDRGGFNNQLLIGRSFLSERVLVDAGAEELVEPSCERQVNP